MKLELLYKDDKIIIAKLVNKENKPPRSLWDGYYLRNSKAYWYRIDEGWGQLRRIRGMTLIKLLDKLELETDAEEEEEEV